MISRPNKRCIAEWAANRRTTRLAEIVRPLAVSSWPRKSRVRIVKARNIDGEHLFDLLQGLIQKRPEVAKAGVVHNDIDAFAGCLNGVEQLLRAVGSGKIGRYDGHVDAVRLAAARRPALPGGRVAGR